MSVESKLIINEKVDNKDRKFGSINTYFPCYIEIEEGVLVPALFTADQIEVAQCRAEENPEDMPPVKRKKWLGIF